MYEPFNVNSNANLNLFLRLPNCASVGEKNFDNYQDARYVRERKRKRNKKKASLNHPNNTKWYDTEELFHTWILST